MWSGAEKLGSLLMPRPKRTTTDSGAHKFYREMKKSIRADSISWHIHDRDHDRAAIWSQVFQHIGSGDFTLKALIFSD